MKWMRGTADAAQDTLRGTSHVLSYPEYCQHWGWRRHVVPVRAVAFLDPQGMENSGSGAAHSHNPFSWHLHSLSVGRVTQRQREIQWWTVKSEPGEAPGSDSQKANAFDILQGVNESSQIWMFLRSQEQVPSGDNLLSDGHAH